MMDEFLKPKPIGDARNIPINVGGILVWKLFMWTTLIV